MENQKNQPEKNKEDNTHYLPMCMCLGMAIGTGIGVALDNMSTYMCVGMSLGVAIGAMLDAKHRKENYASEDVKGNEQIQD